MRTLIAALLLWTIGAIAQDRYQITEDTCHMDGPSSPHIHNKMPGFRWGPTWQHFGGMDKQRTETIKEWKERLNKMTEEWKSIDSIEAETKYQDTLRRYSLGPVDECDTCGPFLYHQYIRDTLVPIP